MNTMRFRHFGVYRTFVPWLSGFRCGSSKEYGGTAHIYLAINYKAFMNGQYYRQATARPVNS